MLCAYIPFVAGIYEIYRFINCYMYKQFWRLLLPNSQSAGQHSQVFVLISSVCMSVLKTHSVSLKLIFHFITTRSPFRATQRVSPVPKNAKWPVVSSRMHTPFSRTSYWTRWYLFQELLRLMLRPHGFIIILLTTTITQVKK